MHVYMYKSYVLIRVGTKEDVRDLPHIAGRAHL